MYENDFKEKRLKLLNEYISNNKTAAAGMIIARICIYSILVPRAILTLWEIFFFIYKGTPLNLIGPAFFITLLPTLHMMFYAHKRIAYVTLATPIIRLLLYFPLLHPVVGGDALGDTYPFILFTVMSLQFVASLIILTGHSCDIYYIGIKRINKKLQKEFAKKP